MNYQPASTDAVGPVPAPDAQPPILQPKLGPMAIGLRAIAVIAGAIMLAWLILFITKGRFLKHPFERMASAYMHRDVRVAGDLQFYFFILDARFRAEGLSISNPAWASAPRLFDARLIDARIDTLSYLFGGKRIRYLTLDGAAIDGEWDTARKRNSWTFGDGKAEPFDPPNIQRGIIDHTRLRYRDPSMALAADIGVETVRAQGREVMNAVRFSGSGSARTTPFTLSGALLSPNETMAGGRNRLTLNIRAARTAADITGTLPGATELDGSDLRIDVRGRNIATLFAVAGIAVPETRAYRLRSALTKAGDEWRFTHLSGRFGDSDLAGTLTVSMRQPRLLLTATLATRVLDIIDVAPFIGYNPDDIAKRGTAATVTTVNGTPRLLPDAPLRTDMLQNFDAQVRYSVGTVRAKSLPVSNVALTLGLDNSLLTLSPLSLDVARGHLDADIGINARRRPVFTDYDIRLSPTPMGRLLAGFGVEESGTSGIVKARIKMTGSGDSVHQSLSTANGRIAIILPKGSFWARNVQLAELDVGTYLFKLFQGQLKEPVQINCGLIGFSVRNGVAAADPILIDTAKSVMVGRGGFSFRNETIDLAFRADGKKFSVFSGQSPVGVGGFFAAPAINPISADLFVRGGAAVALGLAATPFAAVLAFVDVGDAKSAACGPVLAGATATAQRTTRGQPRDDVGRGTTAKAESGKSPPAEKRAQRRKFLGIF